MQKIASFYLLFVSAAILCFGSVAAAGAQSKVDMPDDLSFMRKSRLVIPQSDQAFKADGQMTDSEKQASAEVRRIVTFERSAVGDDSTRFHLAHTGEKLYVGFDITFPPGKTPRTTAQQRNDSALWTRDDALEIRFIVGKKIFGFIGNSAGVRGAIRYDTGDMTWTSDHWSYDAHQTDDGWTGEFLIDAKAFGQDQFKPGQAWPTDIVNNNKTGQLKGWAYMGGKWNGHQETWPRMVFGDKQSPYQNVQRLGVIDQEHIGLESELTNPGKSARQVDVWAHLFRVKDKAENEFSYFEMVAGMFGKTGIDVLPGANQNQRLARLVKNTLLPKVTRGTGVNTTMTIDPGKSQTVDLRRPDYPGKYLVMWRYADSQSGEVLSGGAYPFSDTPPLNTAIEYHYLTAKEVELRTNLPKLADLKSMRYTVIDDHGKVVAEKQVTDIPSNQALVNSISSKDWPHGKLTLRVEALNAGGESIAKYESSMVHPEPPSWWHSDAGNQIAVSHPWTPVEAGKDQASVWGRTYRWSKEGPMPSQIESQGQSLLAEPIRLATKLQGEGDVSWNRERFEKVEAKDAKAVYQGRYRAGHLNLETKTSLAFDGMVRFDLTLSPGGDSTTAERMYLEIPMRREVASMFSRSRFMGLVPAADQPGQWKDQYPEAGQLEGRDKPIGYKFVPWVTLRNDEVGLEWFAEEDWHWSNREDQPKVEIVPRGDQVMLRVRLIDKPTKIDKPRHITFGLDAWPVKPWPEKSLNVSNYLKPYHVPADSLYQNSMGATPKKIRQHIAKAMEHHMDVMWIFHWSGSWGPGDSKVIGQPNYPQLRAVDYPNYHKDVTKRIKTYARITQDLGIPVIGHSGYGMPTHVPDFQTWGMEMARRPLALRGSHGYKQCPNSPFTDAYVTRWKELAKATGWSGGQFDGLMMPIYCQSVRHGCAYRDKQGNVHGKYPIFAQRELARRLYNVFHGEVKFSGIDEGFVYNHGGSATPGPVYAFSDKIHGGEDRSTMNATTLSTIDLDQQRALYANGAFGVPRDMLPKEGKAPVGLRGRLAWALQMGMNMAHTRILEHIDETNYEKDSYPVSLVWAARDWVNARPDNFHGYWENQDQITISPEAFYAGFHLQKGKRLLLIVSNWRPKQRKADIELNLDALGLAGKDLKAQDAITSEMVEINGNRLAPLNVTPDGYRLIKIWAK